MNEEEAAASATATAANKNKQLITMNKLGFLCEIKAHMADVNSLRKRIREEVDLINLEERCLAEFKREMESLNQEKMTHVEELRQIHSDINMLDNVQKQSEEDRNRRLEAVKEAYHQLTAIKGKVDKMCLEVEMPRMYENEEEQFELGDKRQMILSHSGGGGGGGKGSSGGGDSGGVHEGGGGGGGGGGVHGHHHANPHGHGHGPRSMAEAAAAAQVRGGGGGAGGNSGRPLNDNTNTPGNAGAGGAVGGAFSSSLASLMSGFQERHQPPYGRMLSGQSGGFHSNEQNVGVNQGVGSSQGAASAAAAAFRQQPPPMKSCGSCHQQIHRNAPICPLCKAKSRSRHPKRRNNSQRN